MAAQMLKFYHCGIFYGVQERFRPMSVGIIMPEGLHNTEKTYMKSSMLGGLPILKQGVMDHREYYKSKE